MNPEISIVIPVYKGVRFLREALGSVIDQSFADWECLCVDDGSKDGSGALLDEIAADEPRIRVFHRANGGTSVARNFALSQARGRYIAFLDEDDVYHPRMLETLYAAIVGTGADVVGCENIEFDENEHPAFPEGEPVQEGWKVGGRKEVAEWMSDLYRGIPFSIWINLYRRELAVRHGFRPNVRVEQDMLWHYTLLPDVRKYVRIPWAGYAWRRSSTGGFLHPDAESTISWTKSALTVLEEALPRMEMSSSQRGHFIAGLGDLLLLVIWRPLHNGIRMDRGQVARLRDGLRALQGQGVDLDGLLPFVKRIRWKLALRTGNMRWMRSHKAAGRAR